MSIVVKNGCQNFIFLGWIVGSEKHFEFLGFTWFSPIGIHAFETPSQTRFELAPWNLTHSIGSQCALCALFPVEVTLIRGAENTLSFESAGKSCGELRVYWNISKYLFTPSCWCLVEKMTIPVVLACALSFFYVEAFVCRNTLKLTFQFVFRYGDTCIWNSNWNTVSVICLNLDSQFLLSPLSISSSPFKYPNAAARKVHFHSKH